MPKKKIIPAHFLLAFSGNLNKLDHSDRVEDVQMQLEDLNVLDNEEAIRFADLPKQVPEAIRKQLAAKSHDIVAAVNELQMMIDELYSVAEAVTDQKRDAEIDALPHCKECGQVVKPKAKKRRK